MSSVVTILLNYNILYSIIFYTTIIVKILKYTLYTYLKYILPFFTNVYYLK